MSDLWRIRFDDESIDETALHFTLGTMEAHRVSRSEIIEALGIDYEAAERWFSEQIGEWARRTDQRFPLYGTRKNLVVGTINAALGLEDGE